ncbi:MAG: methyltransferase family protein [Alphaproteobacteria bacterium]
MINAETGLIGLMLFNGFLSIPFGILAKRSFAKNGNLTPFLAAWSGVAMHGHALMTFGIAWINRGTLYKPLYWTVLPGLLVLTVGAYIIYLGRKAYGDQSRVYGLKEDSLITHGIYTRSRNPQYFGYGLMFLGAAIASGSMLAFVFVAVFALMVHVGITKVEEPHLECIFGRPFSDYKKRVGRYFTLL